MTPYEREELRRAKGWLSRGLVFQASGQVELATECFALADEHMALAVMTDEDLIQHIAACRSYESGNHQIKGI